MYWREEEGNDIPKLVTLKPPKLAQERVRKRKDRNNDFTEVADASSS